MLLDELKVALNGASRRLKLEVDRDIQRIEKLAEKLGYDLNETRERVGTMRDS